MELSPKAQRSDAKMISDPEHITLNVGGTRFETTRSTLRGSSYFRAMFDANMYHFDEQGQLFIDRDGDLFLHILRFLRSNLRPPQDIVEMHEEALLHECAYFGVLDLANKIRGETCPRDLRPTDRQVYENENMASANIIAREKILLNLFEQDLRTKAPQDLQLPLLFEHGVNLGDSVKILPKPFLQGGFDEFRHRLDHFLGGLLNDLKHIGGIVIAGGAITGALTNTSAGDADLFLIGQPSTAMHTFNKIFDVIRSRQQEKTGQSTKLLVSRSRAALTIYRFQSKRLVGPPIQVIINTYESIASLLLGFDIDCCCCAFDVDSDTVWCSPRAIRAIEYGTNLIHSRYNHGAYCRRLEKYARRGFRVAFPGLESNHLSHKIKNGRFIYVADYDLLVTVGPKHICEQTINLDVVKFRFMQPHDVTSCPVAVKALQQSHAVQSIVRLVVLGTPHFQFRTIHTPRTESCASCQKTGAVSAAITDTAAIMLVDEGHFLLMWNVTEAITAASDQDSSATPLAKIYRLLEQHFEQSLTSFRATKRLCGRSGLDGVVHQSSRTTTEASFIARVENDLANQLLKKQRLAFVYDFVSCDESLSDAHFVFNAKRPPLSQLDDEEFEAVYGLPPRLRFKEAPPRAPILCEWGIHLYRV